MLSFLRKDCLFETACVTKHSVRNMSQEIKIQLKHVGWTQMKTKTEKATTLILGLQGVVTIPTALRATQPLCVWKVTQMYVKGAMNSP